MGSSSIRFLHVLLLGGGGGGGALEPLLGPIFMKLAFVLNHILYYIIDVFLHRMIFTL